ncbi:Do family serine endopeptidase [Methylolobus aquaticus]
MRAEYRPQSLAPMLDRIVPGVVNISTTSRVRLEVNPLFNDPFFRRFFGRPQMPREQQRQSLGSGVVIDAARGYILTNHHVVANADQVTVTLMDERQFEAKLVGSDADTDIAVIKITPDRLVSVPLGNSDTLRVGDFVVAIGNPFGLGQTVTSGIVSALGRSGLGIEGYENFIQTDASVNPGNSGGALVDLDGRLVGINTAIVGPSGGNVGISFAIPSNMARDIMEQLIGSGKVRRGQLGVSVQDLTPELARSFGLKRTAGAVVAQIAPDSPAASAGLLVGDIIIAVNGKSVTNASSLRSAVGLTPPGQEIDLEILRNGASKTLSVAIGAR